MNTNKPTIKILRENSLTELEQAINLYLKDDWSMYGYIFPVVTVADGDVRMWAQAMVKLQWTAKPNPFTEKVESVSSPNYTLITNGISLKLEDVELTN